ncbi:hypothetical protein DCAR_0726734 [Daucus carota subsp. sativus]|uniref:Uncharacterized protein n=1 Tax=Daucus carota subsp. sativus TaxID=79200 RepID=A0A161ZHD1_DAUCS|nr:hypothetical protein DCAR_0726734 [Daucus carota subsp. sativus]
MFEDTDTFVVKVAIFPIVQALVYFILSNSSDVFSDNKLIKSLSFRSARKLSINRVIAAISDIPQGGEAFPSFSISPSPPSQEEPTMVID